jgi:nitrite reductase (NADH) small subunit/3-phenylpropionate/trans-cinnamate dioxygenase ferredoxin subunit
MSDFHTVARVGDIPPGEGRSYCIGGRMIGVIFVDDRYNAINDICPHMGASLSAGPVEGAAVMCPWHAWRFSLCDGSWLDAPKSKVRTETYEVQVVGEEIQVRIPDPPARATSPSPPQSTLT